MKVDFTLRRFPASGAVKDACGMPFSCVVQPFARWDEPQHNQDGSHRANGQSAQQQLPAFMDVVRCTSCYAYINCHCALHGHTWECSVCGKLNEIRPLWAKRYASSPASLPELGSDVYEMVVDEVGPVGAGPSGDLTGPAPVFLALVDLDAGEEWVELVRCGLLAALEALPPHAMFGLITFSNKIGLHDVRAPVPSVRYIPIREGAAASSLPCPLADVLPLRALLAPVGRYKDAISTALEGLAPQASEGGGGAEDMRRGTTRGGRGFGPALLGVVEYLQAVMYPPFRPSLLPGSGGVAGADGLPPVQSPVQLMVFLSGPPDYGAGRLFDPRQAPRHYSHPPPPPHIANGGGSDGGHDDDDDLGEDGWLRDVSPATTAFYQQAAVAAAALGTCVDVYACSTSAVGLGILDPLPNSTGGAMYLYSSVEESALPQDLYRRLAGNRAYSGLMRVRTSRQLKAVRFYGRLYADQQIDALHHIVSCCDTDAYAFDLELTDRAAVVDSAVVQVAFQYTVTLPSPSQEGGEDGGVGAQCVLQRRMRVGTFKVVSARSALDVMRHAGSEALLVVLMHKITRAAHAQGSHAARLLLRDWLVLLASNYHRASHTGPATRGPTALAQAPVDMSFTEAEALQPVPRLVYALLRSPLLAPSVLGQHPDLIPFLEHCWACLPPRELARAVYPVLSSWDDPQHMAVARHSLSRGALMGAATGGVPPPIFLLDAYIVIIVMYTEAGVGAGLPFPPPQQSALRRAVAAIRAERRITPMVRVVRAGTPEAELFFHLLLDEPDMSVADGSTPAGSDASSGTAAFGLVQFMEHVRSEVVGGLRAEAQAAASG